MYPSIYLVLLLFEFYKRHKIFFKWYWIYHSVTCFIHSRFFNLCWRWLVFYQMNIPQFIHSAVNRHLGSSRAFAVLNNSTMKIMVSSAHLCFSTATVLKLYSLRAPSPSWKLLRNLKSSCLCGLHLLIFIVLQIKTEKILKY